MAERTYKLIELVGVSERSYAEATQNAIAKAAETLQGLSWFEVTQLRGVVSGGRVSEYQVTLKVGFRVLAGKDLHSDTAAAAPRPRRRRALRAASRPR
jgi:hypothetical protein